MFRRFIILFAILLVASTAFGDQYIVGHMPPLPNEFLSNPVTLDCGVTIQEVRGVSLDYAHLNSLCIHAYSNFFKFVEAKGLKTSHRKSLRWNASFLPERPCYRCLNDETYRFRYRHVHGNLIGYTDKDIEYAFMSSVRDHQFSTTFVHELFHSMSMYYGVYNNHPGNWTAKTAADEVLAQDFTEWLGYGR